MNTDQNKVNLNNLKGKSLTMYDQVMENITRLTMYDQDTA